MGIIKLTSSGCCEAMTINGCSGKCLLNIFFSFQGGATGIRLFECSSLVVFHIDYPLNVASGKAVLKPEAIKH